MAYNDSFLEKERKKFHSLKKVRVPFILKKFAVILVLMIMMVLIFLVYLPWIQTAAGTGQMTTLNPHHRQQSITALVSGRIKKWYVQEGDIVKKGDPILEIVDNDPDLINRLMLEKQSFSYSYEAKKIAADTARMNYERQQNLYNQQLASRLDVEKAKITYKKLIAEQEKAQVDLQKSQSKLVRQKTQFIYAPMDGSIVQISAGGLATSVKKDEQVALLIPTNVPSVVEIYVSGLDSALIKKGQKVRLQFEGWPAVQFSGWPSVAYGTFGGIVHNVDLAVSKNGKFRVLVIPDPKDVAWPDNRFLRYGAKAKGWVLLETVPLGYELWRQTNAFPPEYVHEK